MTALQKHWVRVEGRHWLSPEVSEPLVTLCYWMLLTTFDVAYHNSIASSNCVWRRIVTIKITFFFARPSCPICLYDGRNACYSHGTLAVNFLQQDRRKRRRSKKPTTTTTNHCNSHAKQTRIEYFILFWFRILLWQQLRPTTPVLLPVLLHHHV